MIQKKLRKEKHSIAFVANCEDNQDRMKEYIRFNKQFGMDRDILTVEDGDIGQFNKKLGEYKIIIYKVVANEIPAKIEEDKAKPVYWELAKFCCDNEKSCVLFTPSGHIPLDGLDNYNNNYYTTVNFYSKLRETLYMLLYFSEFKE